LFNGMQRATAYYYRNRHTWPNTHFIATMYVYNHKELKLAGKFQHQYYTTTLEKAMS